MIMLGANKIVLNIILKKGEALYAIRIVFVDIFLNNPLPGI